MNNNSGTTITGIANSGATLKAGDRVRHKSNSDSNMLLVCQVKKGDTVYQIRYLANIWIFVDVATQEKEVS